MLACQYVIDLPAAFDMQAIRARVAEKGPSFDDWPGLALKPFLLDEPARGGAKRDGTFYLWHTPQALHDFLSGPTFAAVAASFGRPRVRTCLAEDALVPDGPVRGFRQVRLPLAGDRPLAEELAATRAALPPATGRTLLLDPSDWTLQAAVMSAEAQPPGGDLLRAREVLHVSRPTPAAAA
jgi:hypothetical protein